MAELEFGEGFSDILSSEDIDARLRKLENQKSDSIRFSNQIPSPDSGEEGEMLITPDVFGGIGLRLNIKQDNIWHSVPLSAEAPYQTRTSGYPSTGLYKFPTLTEVSQATDGVTAVTCDSEMGVITYKKTDDLDANESNIFTLNNKYLKANHNIYLSVTDTNTNGAVHVASALIRFTDSTCDTTDDDATVDHDANPNIVAGLYVSGDGMPAGVTVASITSSTRFELSAVASTDYGTVGSNKTLTFSRIGSCSITLTNVGDATADAARDIYISYYILGPGINSVMSKINELAASLMHNGFLGIKHI